MLLCLHRPRALSIVDVEALAEESAQTPAPLQSRARASCLRCASATARGAVAALGGGGGAAGLPRGGTAQTRQRITCKYRSASRLGANLPVNRFEYGGMGTQ